jgi:hypothetical protein
MTSFVNSHPEGNLVETLHEMAEDFKFKDQKETSDCKLNHLSLSWAVAPLKSHHISGSPDSIPKNMES